MATSTMDDERAVGAKRHDAKHAIEESQLEERHGLAAAVPVIDCRREKPGTEGFGYDIFTPHHLRNGDSSTRSLSSTNPSPNRYLSIDMSVLGGVLRVLTTAHSY
jgi:CRISPR/Cas system CMR subunit Cmr6 (Cas7 group RAMP superfamily)